MGQYFVVANLTKQQYLFPHTLGSGLKAGELLHSGSVPYALTYLLFQSSAGVLHGEHGALMGSWAGDQIAIVGDGDASGLYALVTDEGGPWRNISVPLRGELIDEHGYLPKAVRDALCRPWDNT